MLDDVVEDLRWREQQPPVERHRARRGAGGPARPLAADRQPAVAGAGARGGRVSRGPSSARARRRYQRSSASRGSPGGTSSVSPRRCTRVAPRLGNEPQRLAEIGHGARRAADLERGPRHRTPAALDPRASSRTASAAWRSGERRGSTTTTSPLPSTLTRTRRARSERRMLYGRTRRLGSVPSPHDGVARTPSARCARAVHRLRERRAPGARARLPRLRGPAHLLARADQRGPARVLALVPGRLGYRHLWAQRPGRCGLGDRRPAPGGARARHRARLAPGVPVGADDVPACPVPKARHPRP